MRIIRATLSAIVATANAAKDDPDASRGDANAAVRAARSCWGALEPFRRTATFCAGGVGERERRCGAHSRRRRIARPQRPFLRFFAGQRR
jgi:hypothetical protein